MTSFLRRSGSQHVAVYERILDKSHEEASAVPLNAVNPFLHFYTRMFRRPYRGHAIRAPTP